MNNLPSFGESAESVEGYYSAYAGRWLAIHREKVIGQGGTPEQAQRAGAAWRHKEDIEIRYIPTAQPFVFFSLLDKIIALVPEPTRIYLVGGAVRDALLGRVGKDLDFVLHSPVGEVVKGLSKQLGGVVFLMDKDTDTWRMIVQYDDEVCICDFTSLRGQSLEDDLKGRDFTINAMAVRLQNSQQLLDPLGGAADLQKGLVRACSDHSLVDDPLRILRGIRLAAGYSLHIEPGTRRLMKEAAPGLGNISSERIRDELFKILDGVHPGSAIRALDLLGVINILLPELIPLKGMEQPKPHVEDGWTHTLHAIDALGVVLEGITGKTSSGKKENLVISETGLILRQFREPIRNHLRHSINPNRSHLSILRFALMMHDTGKPSVKTDGGDEIHFYRHEVVSAEYMERRAKAFELSNTEIDRLVVIVREHMRIHHLVASGPEPSRRAIYRFFRDCGEAGVDIILITLADVLATYGTNLPNELWNRYLVVSRALLNAWFEMPDQVISPPKLLDGNDIMKLFQISPGPLVGEMLDVLYESQAAGEIADRAEAVQYLREWLSSSRQTSQKGEEFYP